MSAADATSEGRRALADDDQEAFRESVRGSAGVGTDVVTLTLSRRDAAVLRTAARFAEGDPAGPRGAFVRINEQLEAQGISLIIPGGPLFSAIVLDCKPEWPAEGGAA